MASERHHARSGSAGTADSGPSFRSVQKGVFCKEGEYWTIGYGGNAFRLKDTRGLGYLPHLLRHPAGEFHLLDLFGGIGSPRGDVSSEAGQLLDDQAKVTYRRRLSELREELEEAKEFGNVERAENAEEEIDALTRELSRAVGLGGRNRRAASASERARQTITKSIKSVLDRIAQSDATLAEIFSRCIKTGTFCSYQPDADFPIAWEFAAPEEDSTSEPVEQSTSSGDP